MSLVKSVTLEKGILIHLVQPQEKKKSFGILFSLLIFPRQRMAAVPHLPVHARDVGPRACGRSSLVPGDQTSVSEGGRVALRRRLIPDQLLGGVHLLILGFFSSCFHIHSILLSSLPPPSSLGATLQPDPVIDKSPLAPDSARLSPGSDAPPLIRARWPRRSIRSAAAAALSPSGPWTSLCCTSHWHPHRTPELGCTMMSK